MAPPAHAATPSQTTAPAPQRPRRSPAPFKSILCAVDVLVARRTGNGNDLPHGIMLASDGSPGSWAAARLATRLSQTHHAELRLVYVPDGMHSERYREVLKQLTAIEKATGSSPQVDVDPGHVAERISQAADAARSSLIVIGHRGLGGAQALGSVSERVANKAKCSVLVVPAAG